MIFEGLDGAFGRVDSVVVWLDKLYGAVVHLHECFDWCCCLIVGDVENGLETFFG